MIRSRLIRFALPSLGLLAAALLAACGGGSDGGDADAAPAASARATVASASDAAPQATVAAVWQATGMQFGVAGLIPRNFPSAAAADWIVMYEGVAETGGVIGVSSAWFDDEATRGQIPATFAAAYGAADRFGFTPVPLLGFHGENIGTGEIWVTIDWADEAETQLYIDAALAIVREHNPPILLLGGEINRIWEQDRESFDQFVAAWPRIYDAVKAVSPETLVGTGFQYEFLRGAGAISGETRDPQWQLLDLFRDNADIFVFSTYPYFDFGSPADIPTDYYSELAEYAEIPIGFIELGWPSRPLYTALDSEYGGSFEEQVAFAERFIELTDGLDVRLALWSFEHDLLEPGGPAFDSISLRENDGTAKPALAIWSAAAAGG